MAERVKYDDRQPFFDLYTDAAKILMTGPVPEAFGSLDGHHGGSLRQKRSEDSGLRYLTCHDIDDATRAERAAKKSGKRWNLDYTIPTVVSVGGSDSVDQISPEDFISELTASLDQERSDDEVKAFAAALVVQYETGWLDYQQRELRKVSKRFAGKSPEAVTDSAYHELAVDVPLRAANLDRLRDIQWRHVSVAHNIATTRYDAQWMLRDRALAAITRPEREGYYGQYAMTPQEATKTLFGKPTVTEEQGA